MICELVPILFYLNDNPYLGLWVCISMCFAYTLTLPRITILGIILLIYYTEHYFKITHEQMIEDFNVLFKAFII